MKQAKNGDTVKVHYTGKLDDGTVFDTSASREPLAFTIGEGQIIPDFEQAVVGMNPGDAKTVRIESDNAYGPHKDEMVMVVNRDQFPEDYEPERGQQFKIRNADSKIIIVTVTDFAEKTVTLDANHPLAGKDLTFDIELVEVE
ncbi:MAG: FKBP-type peptidyl-prolyl cis-trans isomerase [Candidatus Loosdrechtia sp.]|uniref:FKBP-type peptidyl-prolyl cis-trans isomerase n=1 Tax=Candidatus Loosdrechtia sp. TaxID=3101272 RepID=UPI003A6DF75F|nr:MAG: peptidylprolyl isomerase [Candidatus Jettenia sp. AMX2]